MPHRNISLGLNRGATPPWEPSAESRIKQAVVATIAESGFDDLSIDSICARAGVPPATFDLRWSSAEDALADVLDERGRLARLPNTGSLVGDLTAYARAYYEACGDPEFSAFMFYLMARVRRDRGLRERLAPGFERRRSQNRVLIARGVARGEIPPDTDADLILDEVLALTLSWMGQGEAPPDWAIGLAIQSIISPVEVH